MGCTTSRPVSVPARHPSPYPHHHASTTTTTNTNTTTTRPHNHDPPYPINPRTSSTRPSNSHHPYIHHTNNPYMHAATSTRSLRPSASSRLLHSLSTLSLAGNGGGGDDRADSLFEYDCRVDAPVRVVSRDRALHGVSGGSDDKEKERVGLRKKKSAGVGVGARGQEGGVQVKTNVKDVSGAGAGGKRGDGVVKVGLPRRSTLPSLLVARSGEDLRREREREREREERIVEE
ncbi:hypothetical protein HDK77DRAFT_501611 [Phyllosticta capitalensis]